MLTFLSFPAALSLLSPSSSLTLSPLHTLLPSSLPRPPFSPPPRPFSLHRPTIGVHVVSRDCNVLYHGTVGTTTGALETFGRSIAGPLSGYLFDAWGARGIPISCACAAAYVSLALSVRGVGPTATCGEGGGGEGTGVERTGEGYLKRK